MPKPLLLLGGIAILAMLAFGSLMVAASFGDGPTGPFAGGRLSGERVDDAEADWKAAFLRETVEVQVGWENPRSVLACLLLLGEQPYLSITLMPLKSWHETALADGRVIVRLDGKLYERKVRLVVNREDHAALKAIAFEKYGSYEFGDGWAGRNLEFLHLER